MKRPNLNAIIRGRNEIGFETRDYFVRRPSSIKKELAIEFYADFPRSKIAYHISLLGKPNLYVIDIDYIDKHKVKAVIDWCKSNRWDVPIVKFSGRRGYHLVWKTGDDITLRDMKKMTEKISEESRVDLDVAIYRNHHLIRGFYSVHLDSGLFSYIINNKFEELEYDDEMFNLDTFPYAPMEHDLSEKLPDYDYKHDASGKPRFFPIPKCILVIESIGVSEGIRHDMMFALAVFMKNEGYSEETTEIRLLSFNAKCDPPDDEETVRSQVEQVYKRHYRNPSCDWIKSRGFCLNDY